MADLWDEVPPVQMGRVPPFAFAAAALKPVAHRNWEFVVDEEAGTLHLVYGDGRQSQKHRIRRGMSYSDVVQFAFDLVLQSGDREARERFTWHGQPIFGPHLNVKALFYLALKQETERCDDSSP